MATSVQITIIICTTISIICAINGIIEILSGKKKRNGGKKDEQ